MTENKKYGLTAIILAAGSGSRMNSAVHKQRMELCGRSILARAVDSFNRAREVDNIVVVCRADEMEDIRNELKDEFVKLTLLIEGGNTRFESARCGFFAVAECSEYVAIHDAARCLITPDKIDSVAIFAKENGAATAATPVTDTLKRIDGDGKIDQTVSREGLLCAQTPQIFRSDIYARALEAFSGDPLTVTDDNMLVESIGITVVPVDTGRENIKITTSDDLSYAEFLIKKRGCL